MTQTRLGEQVGFILEADKLKEVFRQTICTQSRRPENDAEHSWHLCLAAIVLAAEIRDSFEKLKGLLTPVEVEQANLIRVEFLIHARSSPENA